MIQTNCGVDMIYIANGNDLGEADLYCHQLIFYLNQILRKEERGKEEWGKYQKIFLLFYPEQKISEQSRRIFLAHAYIHEICPKFLNTKTACSFIKI